MSKVFLDLGHGGNDPGAVGNGLRESDISLSVGKIVEHKLIANGVEVKMCRETDKTVSLDGRTNMANNWGANVLVSIHCNSATQSAYGIETFCYQSKYRKLADYVHSKLIENKNLYYIDRGVKIADFHMLRESNMDACLVEMAFISNERDSQLLRTQQEGYATAITKGILSYLGVSYNGSNPIVPPPIPTPPPQKPNKSKVDCFLKVDNYSWVKNLDDYAGLFGTTCKNVYTYPSKGEILFRVSPVNGNYYPWVQNYKVSSGHYDYAGNGIAIDKLQMKLKGLDGYNIRYRVHLLNGSWLPWVQNDSDYAGIQGKAIDGIQCEII